MGMQEQRRAGRIAAGLLVLFATGILRADEPPSQITVDGAGTLPLARRAERTQLLGTVDVYTLGFYCNGSFDPARLASKDVAKAIRIDVSWADDLQRRMRLDWTRELVPRQMEPAAIAHLAASFASLRQGDVVIVEYAPGNGTTVRVNRAVAVSAGHHDVMLAFLDHWLGQQAVSESMKQKLLGSS